jgi:hypothetical protein
MSILLTLGQLALFTPGGCPKAKLELDDARPKTQLRDAKHSVRRGSLVGCPARRAVGFRAIGDASVDEADLIPVQRNLILFFLLWLTATSGAVLVWQSDANMGMTMVSPIMGLRALLFLATWVERQRTSHEVTGYTQH